MARNYSDETTALHKLLEDASFETGATLLIPDLQRQFVWGPTQVKLLVDSLLRGWPFGTLLLWSIKNEEKGVIPHRSFWKIVDRTTELKEYVSEALPPQPQQFKMILDGQQRVQSLLLAFGGDEWGFKLNDKDWYEDITLQRWRGRNPARHWSQGQLFLDLKAFDEQVRSKGDPRKIEYRDVLTWAIGKPDGGQSTAPKPINYNEPLERIFDPVNLGRFVRLNWFWKLAKPNTPEREYREELKQLLVSHSVSGELIERVAPPLAELMVTLNEAKEARVAYLELAALRDGDDPEIYNDAIVNIFTRLNSAGTELTRQEITFAWIKLGWDRDKTDGRDATECFDLLREEMAQHNFHVNLDELVRFVSAVWATIHNGGNLLTAGDLLRGEKIRPMAQNLLHSWKDLHRDLIDYCAILDNEGLRRGEVYASLNAAIVLGAWWCLSRRWSRLHRLNVIDADSYSKQCDSLLRTRADRWLLCSQWAGRWGSSNDQSFAQYISDLSKTWGTIEKADEHHTALNTFVTTIDGWLKKLVQDASDYVRTLEVDQRQFVNAYYAPIWIWLRLAENRWIMATIPLRIGGRQNSFLHVDHIVPVKIWETLGFQPDASGENLASSTLPAHTIGNCILLESSFNISKGKDELDVFLNKVHEFQSGQVTADDWCQDLAIPAELRRPTSVSSKSVADAVNARTNAIKSELVEYVQGERTRKDWAAPKLDHHKQKSVDGAGKRNAFHDLADLTTMVPQLLSIEDRSLEAMQWHG